MTSIVESFHRPSVEVIQGCHTVVVPAFLLRREPNLKYWLDNRWVLQVQPSGDIWIMYGGIGINDEASKISANETLDYIKRHLEEPS